MAIPGSGQVSIGNIRTELQNGGTNNFSLKLAGRPTTGVPGTFQNPVYTPVNLSSANIPNNTAPYSVSEWRRYNHSENLACTGYSFVVFVNDTALTDLYQYEFSTNTLTLLSQDVYTISRMAMTRDKLWLRQGFEALNILSEYDITLSPWNLQLNRTIDFGVIITPNIFTAKSNTILISIGFSSPNYIVREVDISTNTPVQTTLFSTSTYTLGAAIFYDSVTNKLYIPYNSGGNEYVGRFSYTGSLEASVSVSVAIVGLFRVNNVFYGIASNRDIYSINFSTSSSNFEKTAPSVGTNVYGVGQYTYDTSFTSPTLGASYTYYRVQLRGQVNYQSQIEVTGNSTTNHQCYIYTSYPFNNVGEVTATAWTYSFFNSSTTKTFTRTLLNTSETLHFVLYQDQF